MSVFDKLMDSALTKGAGFLTLLDPGEHGRADLVKCAEQAEQGGADALLIGGSLIFSDLMEAIIREIKQRVTLPIIIFPGGSGQVCRGADAILFTSLLSGRNAEYLIGEQVKGAPLVKEYGLEAIPTAYMLIESGARTSVEYLSHTHPMPRHKPDIVKAHALAAMYLGMKMVYLEAGSGAIHSIPEQIISSTAAYVPLPIICGGGIREPEEARRKVEAGASFVVVGNRFEEQNHVPLYTEFAEAIHVGAKAGIEEPYSEAK